MFQINTDFSVSQKNSDIFTQETLHSSFISENDDSYRGFYKQLLFISFGSGWSV